MASRASIIVRSMARPELRDALHSLAAQTHREVEVVLVDATGGHHPAPPAACGPHALRFVPGLSPRSRPVAANAGLDAATGDYIGFLDDDDQLLPEHVSGLAAALDSHPEFAVAYSRSREVDAEGSIVAVRDEPFSRCLLYQDSYLTMPSALFRRDLRATCRFDVAFDVFEDWDFWIQASRVSDFMAVPQETVVYRSSIGRSGIGRGPNRDTALIEAYRQRIAAKWRTEGERAMQELEARYVAAEAAFHAGERARAEALAGDVLTLYRYHVRALSLAGTLAALRADFALASTHFALAVRESPDDADLHFNLAQSLEREGRRDEAAAAYRQVLARSPANARAQSGLARLDAMRR
jgi:hypothetical protein